MASNGKDDRGKPRPRYVWDPQKLAWVEIREAAPSEEAVSEPVKEEVREEVEEEVAKEEPSYEEATQEEEIAEEATSAEPVPAGAFPAIETPPYRGAWIRLLGFDIDLILMAIVYFILSRFVGSEVTTGGAESDRNSLVVAITLGLAFVYFFGFWGWRGQSIGKMIIRARIVRMDGSPAGFARAFLRAVVFLGYFLVASFSAVYVSNLLAIFVFLVVFLVIAFSRKKRGIHDLIAGTCVVDSRVQWPQPEVVEFEDTSEAVETSETSEPEADNQG
jgi:uncharacterized RDD family membrane protein YckC